MNNVKFFTLAAIRMQDPVAFDAMIGKAVRDAAHAVGLQEFAKAVSGTPQQEQHLAIAA